MRMEMHWLSDYALWMNQKRWYCNARGLTLLRPANESQSKEQRFNFKPSMMNSFKGAAQ